MFLRGLLKGSLAGLGIVVLMLLAAAVLPPNVFFFVPVLGIVLLVYARVVAHADAVESGRWPGGFRVDERDAKGDREALERRRRESVAASLREHRREKGLPPPELDDPES